MNNRFDDILDMDETPKANKKLNYIIIAIAVLFLLASGGLTMMLKTKNVAETVTCGYISDVTLGEFANVNLEMLGATLNKAANKPYPVKISFEVRNGRGGYMKTLETPNFLFDLEIKKEKRMDDAKIWLNEVVKPAAAEYAEAQKESPVKVIVLVEDITGGVPTVNLEEKITEADLSFLRKKGNEVIIKFFAWGANSQSGDKTFKLRAEYSASQREKKLEIWSKQINSYLATAGKDSRLNSDLIAQYFYMLDELSEYNEASIYIRSDMLHNTDSLSAYYPERDGFISFVKNDAYDFFEEVKAKALTSAKVTDVPASLNAKIRIILPDIKVGGKKAQRIKWHSAMEEFLEFTNTGNFEIIYDADLED